MLCLIPARGGSQRIKRKNIRDFMGLPIIAYSIETALDSELFDDVIVSTEDTEIARIAEEYGAGVITRSETLAQNEIGTQKVAQDAFNRIRTATAYSCVLYATCPLLTIEDLVRGIETLRNWPKFDYAYSVSLINNGNVNNDAGQFYWGRPSAWIEGKKIFDRHSVPVIIPRWRVQDIDNLDDWKRAELIFNKLDGRKHDSCR